MIFSLFYVAKSDQSADYLDLFGLQAHPLTKQQPENVFRPYLPRTYS
jgi:hypothetical protein